MPRVYKVKNTIMRRSTDFNTPTSESGSNDHINFGNIFANSKYSHHSGVKSGRVSQLAGRIEELFIQVCFIKNILLKNMSLILNFICITKIFNCVVSELLILKIF